MGEYIKEHLITKCKRCNFQNETHIKYREPREKLDNTLIGLKCLNCDYQSHEIIQRNVE